MKLKYTANQEQLACSIVENTCTVAVGVAGTGKTLVSLITAVNQLKQGEIDQILITRTLVGAGSDIGWLPGNAQEKSAPYFLFIHEYLKQLLDKEYDKYIQREKIKVLPLEILRGHTYHNCIIIADEAQNNTPSQIKMLIGRLGRESKIVIIGDSRQRDIDVSDGLYFCENELQGLEDCAVIKMSYKDVMRNPKVAHILKRFDERGH